MNEMRILVTFAVEHEFAPWRRMRHFRRVASFPNSLFDSQIDACAVRVVLTGMGWEHARQASHSLLWDGTDVCICSGFAGGLKSAFRPCDVLAARQVSEVKGARVLDSDQALLQKASSCGAQVVNQFLSSRRTVIESREKQQLGRFGDAVDMESFRVLAAARGRGIPTVAVRVVSDPVEHDMPLDFNRTVDPQGQISIPRVIGQLARNPRRLPGLVRLGRDSQHAAKRLAFFLDRFVGELATSARRAEMQEEVAAL